MDVIRSTTVSEPASENQIRRAERGVVAAYIHQLSERHGHRHASQAETQLPSEPGEGD
jgi:hypothetical protein